MTRSPSIDFSTSFERIFISALIFISGLILIFLGIQGPLVQNILTYKTSPSGVFQIMGQDLVNLSLLAPLMILSSVTLFLRLPVAKYLIMIHPLYIIYYVMSYLIGQEWSSSAYQGTCEKYAFYFLFVLVSGVFALFYGLSIFPKNIKSSFKKKPLAIYSALYLLFLLLFALMWIAEIQQVTSTGTTRAYQAMPTGFWTIRTFDLGFTIPLGLLSLYLLWTRPQQTAGIQFMFYGFFLTMILAVNSMGLIMYLGHDPDFQWPQMVIFGTLGLIVLTGFAFILKNFSPTPVERS